MAQILRIFLNLSEILFSFSFLTTYFLLYDERN